MSAGRDRRTLRERARGLFRTEFSCSCGGRACRGTYKNQLTWNTHMAKMRTGRWASAKARAVGRKMGKARDDMRRHGRAAWEAAGLRGADGKLTRLGQALSRINGRTTFGTWHPARSARVMWHATWQGENDPPKVIALVTASMSDVRAVPLEPYKDMDIDPDKIADKHQDISVARNLGKPQVARSTKTVTGQDRAADIIRRHPGLSNAEVAKRAHVSEKTVSRARSRT